MARGRGTRSTRGRGRGRGRGRHISYKPGSQPGRLPVPQSCGAGQIAACDGTCWAYYLHYMLGDGFCNDGTSGMPNYNCAQFNFDGGDCSGGMRGGGRVRRQMGGGPKPWNR